VKQVTTKPLSHGCGDDLMGANTQRRSALDLKNVEETHPLTIVLTNEGVLRVIILLIPQRLSASHPVGLRGWTILHLHRTVG